LLAVRLAFYLGHTDDAIQSAEPLAQHVPARLGSSGQDFRHFILMLQLSQSASLVHFFEQYMPELVPRQGTPMFESEQVLLVFRQ